MILDGSIFAVVAAIMIVAGALKGIIGIGMQATAVPLLVLVSSVREAILIMALPLIALNIWQALEGGQALLILRRLGLFIMAMCAGVWIGTTLLLALDASVLSGVTGAVVCVFALSTLIGLPIRTPPGQERLIAPFVGFGSGILGGVSGMFGPVVVSYLASLSLDKDAFIRATAMVFLVVSTIWLGALVKTEAMTASAAVISAAATVPALLGMLGGQYIRRWISEDRFRRYVLVFLLIIGISLLGKAIF